MRSSLALALIPLLACSRSITPSNDGGDAETPSNDGGDAQTPSNDGGDAETRDPASCDCRLDGGTLLMSWDCYCTMTGGCDRVRSCDAPVTALQCGLTVSTQEGAPGLSTYVRDATGTLVGADQIADIGIFACPTDPSMTSARVRAGQFPDPSCGSSVRCSCSAGDMQYLEADAGGTIDRCGCRIEGGVLVMAWSCFCDAFGCDDPLTPSTPGRRTNLPWCNLVAVGDGSSGISESEYATNSGVLVGRTLRSDTSPYVCPTNPALSALAVRGGCVPDGSCYLVTCSDCTAPAGPR